MLIKKHILYFAVLCTYIFLISFFKIRCPFISIFNVPCPTCGVTRALASIMMCDFKGYFDYHPLAIPLVISVILMLHIKLLKRKRIIYLFVAIVLFANSCLYIARLIQQKYPISLPYNKKNPRIMISLGSFFYHFPIALHYGMRLASINISSLAEITP